MNITQRKPPWLRRKISAPGKSGQVNHLLHDLSLHTVCQEAHCPNQGECYAQGTATFLLLGPACTRNCTFCAVQHQGHVPPDSGEPGRTAEAVARMGLEYCVLTMVTRDDLPDGGARQVAETINAIRQTCPETLIEVLISDLGGDPEALNLVLEARPEVLNHNLETVPRLYPTVRPQAMYQRSLKLIQRAQAAPSGPVTKSGLMLGLGGNPGRTAGGLSGFAAGRLRFADPGSVSGALGPSPPGGPLRTSGGIRGTGWRGSGPGLQGLCFRSLRAQFLPGRRIVSTGPEPPDLIPPHLYDLGNPCWLGCANPTFFRNVEI